MGREIQKKKRRSKSQPIRQSNRLKKPLNPLGNSTIAANWFVLPNPPGMDRGSNLAR
jgi:nucleolar protein 16